MNKKHISFLFAALLLALSVIPVYAVFSQDSVKTLQYADEPSEKTQEEISMIKTLLKDESSLKISEAGGNAATDRDTLLPGKCDADKAKKVYLSQTLLVTVFEETHDVDKLFTDSYSYYAPIEGSDDAQTAVFGIENGRAYLGGWSTGKLGYISDEELLKSISESGIDTDGIKSIKYLNSAIYQTVFAVIYTDSQVYCVPFAAREDFLGLENAKAYELEDMMNFLLKRFDEKKMAENPDSNGGVPLRENNGILITIIIFVSAIAVIISAVCLIRMRKKNKV